MSALNLRPDFARAIGLGLLIPIEANSITVPVYNQNQNRCKSNPESMQNSFETDTSLDRLEHFKHQTQSDPNRNKKRRHHSSHRSIDEKQNENELQLSSYDFDSDSPDGMPSDSFPKRRQSCFTFLFFHFFSKSDLIPTKDSERTFIWVGDADYRGKLYVTRGMRRRMYKNKKTTDQGCNRKTSFARLQKKEVKSSQKRRSSSTSIERVISSQSQSQNSQSQLQFDLNSNHHQREREPLSPIVSSQEMNAAQFEGDEDSDSTCFEYYKCKDCGDRFEDKADLLRHLRNYEERYGKNEELEEFIECITSKSQNKRFNEDKEYLMGPKAVQQIRNLSRITNEKDLNDAMDSDSDFAETEKEIDLILKQMSNDTQK